MGAEPWALNWKGGLAVLNTIRRSAVSARAARFAADEAAVSPPDHAPGLSVAPESQATEQTPASSAPVAPATLDVKRQAQARRYARQQQRLSLVSLGLSALLVGILLFSGLSFWLRDAIAFAPGWAPLAGWQPWRLGAYFLVLFLATFVLGLPLSYYSGYILPRRNGISTQTVRGWLADEGKGLALSLVFEIVAVEGMYALLAASPRWWWLWAGGALLVITVLLANLAPVLLMPLFYKFTPLADGEVKRRALALAARAHVSVRGIYTMNMSARTTAANAMVTGLGSTRRIVIGDTLLDHYTPDEIEVVVAHELGHQAHYDIPKLIAVQTVTMLGGLYVVSLILAAALRAFPQYAGLADPATLPLIVATLGVFGLVTLPLTNGFSRWVEHQADVYALETTGMSAAFVSAMTRLANQNLSEVDPSPVIEFLLYNHPSVGRRLAFGQRWARQANQAQSGAGDARDGSARSGD